MSAKPNPMEALRAGVQYNCNVADMRHASDYSLCVYLMKMREYYRWEKGYDFATKLPSGEVGSWLDAREQLWDNLHQQGADYQPLSIHGHSFDPYDNDGLNQQINSQGCIYSGGLGVHAAPHFFLAQLKEQQQLGQYQVFISGAEYARDLAAPPAMRRGNTIFIRQQSLQRMLWEKYCEWNWNKSHRALGQAFAFYPYESNPEQALHMMSLVETDTALLHEIGELKSAEQLGEEWQQMLAELPRSRAEIALRALKDMLADCVHTLPTLINKQKIPSLHFYFASLSGMRKTLSPSLQAAAHEWCHNHNDSALLAVIHKAAGHWQQVAQTALQHYRQRGGQAAAAIVGLLEEQTF